jgi:hypothetical protein
MTSFQPSQIIEEFKNFIHISCTDCIEDEHTYSSLHKGIIKMYFAARKVEIDYENHTIQAEIPISDHQYTTVNFECQDLSRFLSSCVKNDRRCLKFYQSALNYYNHVPGKLTQVA